VADLVLREEMGVHNLHVYSIPETLPLPYTLKVSLEIPIASAVLPTIYYIILRIFTFNINTFKTFPVLHSYAPVNLYHMIRKQAPIIYTQTSYHHDQREALKLFIFRNIQVAD
jgi:hypothetical protein